jgi:hypothetical protein
MAKRQIESVDILRCVKQAFAREPGEPRGLAAIFSKGVCLCLLAAGLVSTPADAAEELSHQSSVTELLPSQDSMLAAPPRGQSASFLGEPASSDAHRVADWVVDSRDNRGKPFLIVDKGDAKVFVFDSSGQLRGAAPALLGLAKGDDSVPGIGQRKLSGISPQERTTPAGRFVAALGRDLGTQDILWVDYDTAISLHRVITTNRNDRRLERLATPSPLDNRISYGCINVPVKFYETIVNPAFTGTDGVVYILPETRSIRDVFPGLDGPSAVWAPTQP